MTNEGKFDKLLAAMAKGEPHKTSKADKDTDGPKGGAVEKKKEP